MTQVLEMGLAPQELKGFADKAKESLSKPGVAVEIPRFMVERLDSALQGMLTEQLVMLREQARTMSQESLELRVR